MVSRSKIAISFVNNLQSYLSASLVNSSNYQFLLAESLLAKETAIYFNNTPVVLLQALEKLLGALSSDLLLDS